MFPAPRQPFAMDDIAPGVRVERAPGAYVEVLGDRLRSVPSRSIGWHDDALARAAGYFRTRTIAGKSLAQYVEEVSALTQMPSSVISESAGRVAAGLSAARLTAERGLPSGGCWSASAHELERGVAQFSRRGEVLAVVAPGNGPGVHAIWPQALALGYAVMVRPSDREPFTAERLVGALCLAGYDDRLALVPMTHATVERLISAADLSLVYGGDSTVQQYKNRADVLVQGPGRSKVVIGEDADEQRALTTLHESVAGLGGASCMNASVAVIAGGDGERWARLYQRYAMDRRGSADSGRMSLARSGVAERYRHQLVEGLSSPGSPLVFSVEDPLHELISKEFPFPAVTFVGAGRDEQGKVLPDSLVVSAVTWDPELRRRVSEVRGIRNLYFGDTPTTWVDPLQPHDGYLSEFLMTTRGYRET